jgi:hypothetical protein
VSIERPTAADQIMLWPDQIWPQDIGAIAVLDGSNLLDPDGRFRIEAIREAVASRLHLRTQVPLRPAHFSPRRCGVPALASQFETTSSTHLLIEDPLRESQVTVPNGPQRPRRRAIEVVRT